MSDILVTTRYVGVGKRVDPRRGPFCVNRSLGPCLADVVARPKFSATAKVAEAIETSHTFLASHTLLRPIITKMNKGTSELRMFPGYGPLELPVGINVSFDGLVKPGLPAEAYAWHPATAESFVEGARPEFAEVYFPVLAAVLPKWINGFVGDLEAPRANAANANGAEASARTAAGGPSESANADADANVARTRRVLYLVSGYGAPVNASHAPESNSTEAMARVMKRFVEWAYPGLIDVRLAHSGNGVFRYDKNVSFVSETLRPAVARHRDAVASAFGEEWVKRFKLTVALCDGTPARLHALMATFRDMRPYLAHAFRLKRFWHDGELDTGDVDIQRWARAEAAPPIPLARLELALRGAGVGVGASSADIARAGMEASVTLRLVREMKAHRRAFAGAAKRGAHALTSFWLRKTRKPVLAVLCAVKAASATKPRRLLAADDFEFHRGVNLEVSMPTGSLCSERNAIGNALAANPGLTRKDMFGIAVLSLRARDVDGSVPDGSRGNDDAANPPLCRDVASVLRHDENETAIFAPSADGASCLNPLRPCGACKEWLNKIAEVNPGFRVLMFSDVTCDEVYVKEVGQC